MGEHRSASQRRPLLPRRRHACPQRQVPVRDDALGGAPLNRCNAGLYAIGDRGRRDSSGRQILPGGTICRSHPGAIDRSGQGTVELAAECTDADAEEVGRMSPVLTGSLERPLDEGAFGLGEIE